MIIVKVKGSSVEVSGHAGHSPIGTDIVCAGISALYQTIVESAMEFRRNV
ncbi:MAG: ribosomal-processing cysteine protease Prp [Mogibacterium diversum]|nr:ribosomal-processing cysteine protease Prp [Mogibacterium diversum]MBF1359818.1 ribosomal-processing cysteine protease Prp [Mogibacterium diversum]